VSSGRATEGSSTASQPKSVRRTPWNLPGSSGQLGDELTKTDVHAESVLPHHRTSRSTKRPPTEAASPIYRSRLVLFGLKLQRSGGRKVSSRVDDDSRMLSRAAAATGVTVNQPIPIVHWLRLGGPPGLSYLCAPQICRENPFPFAHFVSNQRGTSQIGVRFYPCIRTPRLAYWIESPAPTS
jgi:hypothetical protein